MTLMTLKQLAVRAKAEAESKAQKAAAKKARKELKEAAMAAAKAEASTATEKAKFADGERKRLDSTRKQAEALQEQQRARDRAFVDRLLRTKDASRRAEEHVKENADHKSHREHRQANLNASHARRELAEETRQKLIAAKADVNALDERDIGALYCAAAYNQGRIVEVLLAAGADPNTRCDSGKTAAGGWV